jgi:hypothetical protein
MYRLLIVHTNRSSIVVLMHELGHCIGIYQDAWDSTSLPQDWDELYDSQGWSVMVEVDIANCNADPIRYSVEYWNLRDLKFYRV